VFIDDGGNVQGNLLIDNNVITNVQRIGIVFDTGSTFNGNSFSAKITNNRVGIRADNTIDRVGKGTALGAGGENGIRIENRNQNGKNLNVLVQNNLIYNGSGVGGSLLNSSGLLIRTQNNATMSATVSGNTVNVDNLATSYGFNVQTTNGTANILCLDASGNTITAPGGGFNLAEVTGMLNIEQASTAALSSANGGASASVSSGTPQFGVACAAPPS
jgi:hypothetical protein